MNENQTDIFGGVTPFQTEEPKQEPVVENQYNNEVTPIFNEVNESTEVIDVPEEIVKPVDSFNETNENTEVTDAPEEISKPVDSFNEMPFAGVNQQQEVSEIKENYISNPVIEESEKNENMEPIKKSLDENSGLKFLLVLGLIFAIFIIILPFL